MAIKPSSTKVIVDPLFQTFRISSKVGVYITKVGLFFESKSDKDSVTLSIRDAYESGISPNSSRVIPSSEVTLGYNQVSVDATSALAETVFQFDEPVYLAPGKEYAIAIASNDGEGYRLWAATVGDFNLGTTTRRVTKDPITGTMFRSSGGIGKVADATTDLKYKIYRAKFKSTSGTAVLKDANPPKIELINNPITTTNSSSTVRINHPFHGFQVNDRVHISGLTSGTSYNGITGAQLLGTRIITAVDASGYELTAGGTANVTGRTGGQSVRVTRQYVFDMAKLMVDEYLPQSLGEIKYTGSFTTSKSYAASTSDETPYATTSNIPLLTGKDYHFNQPHVVLSDSNETVHYSGNESTSINAVLTNLTTSDFISPYIDMQRASMLAMNNMIDRQDSAATVGFSNPLNFVPETDPTGGTELAKHITKPVVLEEASNGLKINFAAHCPINGQIDTYYRTTQVGRDSDIQLLPWVYVQYDETPPKDADPNVYRNYEANLGGEYYDQLPHFDQYQLKLVMRSQSSSRVPKIRDLRTIALAADSA
jgi:hypothetical protein